MIDAGVKISQAGRDVITTIDPRLLILNTNLDTLKIWKTVGGDISVTDASALGNETATRSFRHGLGYTPMFLAYYKLKDASSSWWLDETALAQSDPDKFDNIGFCDTRANPEEIEFSITEQTTPGGTNTTYNCAYKALILINPAQSIPPSVQGAPLSIGYGLKASKPGINVLEAKAHELLVSSRFPSLNLHMDVTKSVTVTAGGTTGSFSFQHGLGYTPVFLGMLEDLLNDPTMHRQLVFTQQPTPTTASIKSDRSTTTFVVNQPVSGSNVTYTARILVFKNKLSDL